MKLEGLKRIRKEKNMTQEELANKIGVRRAVISKYENGVISPTLAQLEIIASALDVSITDLVPPEMYAGYRRGFSEAQEICNEAMHREDYATSPPVTEDLISEIISYMDEGFTDSELKKVFERLFKSCVGRNKVELEVLLEHLAKMLEELAEKGNADKE